MTISMEIYLIYSFTQLFIYFYPNNNYEIIEYAFISLGEIIRRKKHQVVSYYRYEDILMQGRR